MAKNKESETPAVTNTTGEGAVTETNLEGNVTTLNTETVEKPKDPKADWVTIELFRDGDKYKDDVVVAVNGKMYQIQRGVPVKVPPAVYEVLQNSKKQDAQANSFVEKLEADYANKANMLR